jgi:hypothetical protein
MVVHDALEGMEREIPVGRQAASSEHVIFLYSRSHDQWRQRFTELLLQINQQLQDKRFADIMEKSTQERPLCVGTNQAGDLSGVGCSAHRVSPHVADIRFIPRDMKYTAA